ncbi:MAG: hypothetical protein IT384_09910 [Deltaproteobacteria bacterium]|nr:hypothetical protein [Deltaproteobacteria bacterium]
MFRCLKHFTKLSVLAATLSLAGVAHAAEGAYAPPSQPSGTLRLVLAPDQAPRTGVKLTLTEVRAGETRTQQIIAILIGLLSSPALSLGDHAALPAHVVGLPGDRRGVEVSLRPLLDALASQGWTVTQITAGDPPPVVAHPAEATWVGIGPFGWWTCELEQADVDWCNNLCGGEGFVDSLSSEPEIPSNNPFLEPSCETTCECKAGHGDGGVRTDPPAVSGLEGSR